MATQDHEPGFRVETDVEIQLRDGSLLYGNVFRRDDGRPVPAIVNVGPYGKDISFSEFNPRAYAQIDEQGPRVHWETPTPDWWVPRGYAIVRVDQRGTGRSPGRLDLNSPQQALDFYDVVEWIAAQEWCTGKVGLCGISYYALNQWQVAALRPPSLAAMIPWEGGTDLYRDWAHPGGIFNGIWMDAWWRRQLIPNQFASHPDRALADGNVDYVADSREHDLDDEFYAERSPDVAAIDVPLLSVANWSVSGLFLRGNVEGYLDASSEHKWLQVHAGNHITPFYTEESKQIQLRFFDCFLKGIENDQLKQPPIRLAIRRGNETTWRHENEWPLARTVWQQLWLDATDATLSEQEPVMASIVSYPVPGGQLRFVTPSFTEDVEVTGPLSCNLWMSAVAVDMNVCVAILDLDESGREVVIDGGRFEPNSVAYGWLRASHRALDSGRSTPARPYHTHQKQELLEPGEIVLLNIEIWPTSMVFAAGHRLGLVVGPQDHYTSSFPHPEHQVYEGENAPGGVRFTGLNSIHTGPEHQSFLLLPTIPS